MIQRIALALLLAVSFPALAQDTAPLQAQGFESSETAAAEAADAPAQAEAVGTPAVAADPATNTVLITTVLSVVTVSGWLLLLGI